MMQPLDQTLGWLLCVFWVALGTTSLTLTVMLIWHRRSSHQTVAAARMVAITLCLIPALIFLSGKPALPIADLDSFSRETIPLDGQRLQTGPVPDAVPSHQFPRKSKKSSFLERETETLAPNRLDDFAMPGRNQILVWLWGLGTLFLTFLSVFRQALARIWMTSCQHSLPAYALDTVSRIAADEHVEVGQIESKFLIHADVRSPITIGLFRSRIVLPADKSPWTASQLDMVIRHEWHHLRNRDAEWCFLWDIVRGCYWLLPPVWMLHRIHLREIEWACDDAVIVSTRNEVGYAETLLTAARQLVAQRRTLPPSASTGSLSMASRKGLQQRIERTLNTRVDRSFSSKRGICVVAFLVLTGTLVSAAVRPSLPNQSSEPQNVSAVMGVRYKGSGKIVPLSFATQEELAGRITAINSDGGSRNVLLSTSPDLTHRLLLMRRNGQLASEQILIGVGESDLIANALQTRQMNGVVSHQPHGFGFRAVEILCKRTQLSVPDQDVALLAIPARQYSESDPGGLSRSLAKIRDLKGESYSTAKIASPEVNAIEISIPDESPWWQVVIAGCQQAADQYNVELKVNVSTASPNARRRHPGWTGPVLHVRHDGKSKTGFIEARPSRETIANGLWMFSDEQRIAEAIISLTRIKPSSVAFEDSRPEPTRILVLYDASSKYRIDELCERLDQGFSLEN